MNKLVRELDKVKEKQLKEKTSDDILNDAKQLLLNSYNEDNRVLEQIGLDHQLKYSRNLETDIKRTKLAEERYKKTAYTGAEVKELCNRYDLRILPASKYNGSIPVDLASKIKEFCDSQDIIMRQNSFYVLAPVEQFKTLKHVPIQADPILFYLDGSAESRSSYKYEISETDNLINVHYWGKDFSFLREFRYFFNWYRNREDDFSNMTRTIIAFSIFIGALLISFLTTDTVGTIFPIACCLLSGAWLGYNNLYKKDCLNELWNTDKI